MNRLKLIFFALGVFFLVVWIRLFYWQVVAGGNLKKSADEQHFYRLDIPAIRGQILSSDGSPLVTNRPAYMVYVEKNKIKNKETLIKEMAPILEETEASISAKLSINNLWIPLKNKVEEETVKSLRNLNFLELGFEREDKRYYPEASMSAHLLGFIGKDELGNDKGYFGLEGYYDKELSGQNGYLQQEKDAFGNPIVIGENERIDAVNGRSIQLYLDKAVQFVAEEKLKEGLSKYKAKSGNVIIIDPLSGGILASASYPSYDSSHYWNFPKEFYKNPIISQSYEPGSTFKVLLMAKALDDSVVTPLDKMNEDGPATIGEYKIKTWDEKYHGEISMTQVLEYSSNVGMVYVAKKLGREKMINTVKDYGFGKPTNVDLQDESSPELRADRDWKEIDLMTASFGQGIAVTPLQMVMAVGVLANDGILMEPKVVKKILSDDGKVIEIKPKEVKRIIKSSTAKMIAEMMVQAVDNGEAKWAKPKGYRIAGKTGTAQIPVAGHYDAQKTIASFVGFAPADKPKFVMLVTLTEPQSSPWGSETAAPLFFDVAKELLNYYGLAPS